ncbi:MAG TPA: protein kinase, partial [Urbifossiella sp.]|nr:protein kinase [Urbifossiella sp.]
KPDPAKTLVSQPASERKMSQPFERGAPVFGTSDAPWTLVQRLGAGGFGQVWEAANPDSGELRAVKFFTHEVRRTNHAKHEMRVASHVLKHMQEHPDTLANIVPLLSSNLDLDHPWLMYRLVPGGRCLNDVIGEMARQPKAERQEVAVPLLRTIAAAVGRMHRLKTPIVHRDLKPSNVLMDGDTPMISDFGIGGASVIGAISDSTGGHTTMSAGLNLPTHLHRCGTLKYSCPRQLAGDPPDPRDDVYSLAVIAFQLIEGDLSATPGADSRDAMEDGWHSYYKPLVGLIVRNLSSAPTRRQSDAAEFAKTLADYRTWSELSEHERLSWGNSHLG